MFVTRENARFSLYAFSGIYVLTGTALITIGAIYLSTFNELAESIPGSYVPLQLVPILATIVGFLVFAVALFGCCSIFIDQGTALYVYSGLLFAVVLFQIGVGALALAEIRDRDAIASKINRTLDDIFSKAADEAFISALQSQLGCCGTYGPNFWYRAMDKALPLSCCANDACEPFGEGCQSAVSGVFVQAARVSGISMLAFALTEASGAAFAVWYAANMTRGKGYRRSLIDD